MNDTFDVRLLELNKPTINHHTYPTALIKEAITTAKKPLLGGFLDDTADFPFNAAYEETVSHEIIDLRIEGDYLVGTAKILNNDHGVKLREMIERGVKLNFAPSGIGVVESDGTLSDYVMTSVDVSRVDP